ncbi:HAMP domain-containing sensor histidine kinase [Singulisphaera sp. Ch08]|uniref:histidine kinase n=1 Tax=Singulisphaera sp. Ch08 TaxID=3120278 RepID=A0AAU7C636_9BACT
MSDQRMPEMSGVELLHHARQIRPEATRLLFTAYADIRAVVDAINEGNIFRYIAKPWDPAELESVIRQAVDQHDLIVEKARLVDQLQATNRQLVEANRLKAAFIEVASHELNTPVAVMLGMTELWKMSQDKNASPLEKGWVERIQGAGKRLAGTVERMLKLVRSGQFGHTLSLEPTVLDTLVRQVVTELTPYLDARDQTVTLDLRPELGIALVDAAKFSDILTNLLINAIKFTPDGGTLRVAAGPHGPDHVRFEVADPGVGIEEADCVHLFEPFFTSFDTMHHSSGDYQFGKRGIGLGLCLVKTFVELHGGTIEVASSLGEGSTFAFIIPRGVPAALVTSAPG